MEMISLFMSFFSYSQVP